MTAAGREVRERHPVRSADAGVHVVHLRGKAVGRQPLDHRVGVEKSLVDALGCRAQDAVQTNRIAGHDPLLLWCISLSRTESRQIDNHLCGVRRAAGAGDAPASPVCHPFQSTRTTFIVLLASAVFLASSYLPWLSMQEPFIVPGS